MHTPLRSRRRLRPFTTIVIAASCIALAGIAPAKQPVDTPAPSTVPKATCGPNDRPETGLQGQVSAAERAAGFKGFNCNLELLAQSKGDGANWQSAQFSDGNRICAYHGSASPSRSLPGRNPATLGVPIIDVSDATNPVRMGYLQTTSMLDPWESLKVNERRKLLAADNGQNGGGGPEIDIYDLSDDCRFPQLLATVAVGKADGSTGVPGAVIGHEGSWAPDGLTYYGGDLRTNGGQYYAVDTVDPTSPKLITRWTPGFANVHGLSISDDGTRGYFVSLRSSNPTFLNDPNQPASNGLLIYDLTDIQTRQPNPQPKLISTLFWKDGATAQHTINVKIDGKPYIIFVDEAGSGGNSAAGWAAACAAGMPAWPMARIIDISDEMNPKIVSRLALQIHDPANCAAVLPDLAGLGSFTYGSHYCSVDNRHHATTLACGYFNSGIRVFDIRDPVRPKEIAYYNPAGTPEPSPGSNHTAQWRLGGPDWCSAQVHLDHKRGTLWTTCQDNGLLMLKFTNGVWPFPESSTPPGQQN